jgi:hypothetical protein
MLNEVTTKLQTIESHSLIDIASYPGRLESPNTPLRKPQIVHTRRDVKECKEQRYNTQDAIKLLW